MDKVDMIALAKIAPKTGDGDHGYLEPLEHVLRHPFTAHPSRPIPLKDYQELYNNGLVVISTFEYDVQNNIASFWMSTEDAVNVFGDSEEKQKDWKASLWGFMYWMRYSPVVDVQGNLEKGEAWFS